MNEQQKIEALKQECGQLRMDKQELKDLVTIKDKKLKQADKELDIVHGALTKLYDVHDNNVPVIKEALRKIKAIAQKYKNKKS